MRYACAFLIAAAFATPAAARYSYSSHPGAATPILSSMPDHVEYGDTVMVDDHSCPAGQIKQVTGGSRKRGVAKTKECVPRP